MGSTHSTPGKDEEQRERERKERLEKEHRDMEHRRRANLEKELRNMEHSLRVTAACHYESAEYYNKINDKLQFLSWFAAMFGTSGGVVSKLAWKSIYYQLPRGAPVFVAVSVTCILFTVTVRLPNVPYSPDTMYSQHFRAGLECQHLQKRVRFMADTKLSDLNIQWREIADDYLKLLAEKKEVNSRIQTQEWTYFKALEKVRDKDKRKLERKTQDVR